MPKFLFDLRLIGKGLADFTFDHVAKAASQSVNCDFCRAFLNSNPAGGFRLRHLLSTHSKPIFAFKMIASERAKLA